MELLLFTYDIKPSEEVICIVFYFLILLGPFGAVGDQVAEGRDRLFEEARALSTSRRGRGA